jgi:FMN phosphatase YigB (HAD superfamily)
VNFFRAESTCSAWFSTKLSVTSTSSQFAVTFDLWQTLIFEADGSAKSNARRVFRTKHSVDELALLGEHVDASVVDGLFLSLSDEITEGHDHGLDAQYDEWILKIFDRIAPGVEGRVGTTEVLRIGRVIDRTFIESPPLLLDGSVGVLEEIASKGVKIGLISNTGLTSPELYREWFELKGILDKFDFLSFSNEQEVAKPNRAIFETTVEGLGVDANRTLHVGDNIHTDVGGAAAVGMSTVWVRGGVDSPVGTDAKPDFSVDSILELPVIVDRWASSFAD